MAFLDTEQGELVIRIVLDGSPLSGKTTTAQSLANSLGATVEVPEEVLGRTIFFDWLEYTGGLWNGHKIRCQILTVPGQRSLGARRFELLRLADCVIFVFDTSSPQVAPSLTALDELGCVLRTLSHPWPSILVQLNKRDLPNAVSREELDALLLQDYGEIVETVATNNAGFRDVFIRAVRLALNHVKKLQKQGDLPRCPPDIQNSEHLMDFLIAQEQAPVSR